MKSPLVFSKTCPVSCVVMRFVLFVFVLCLVYSMLPVYLDCQFMIAPLVFSNLCPLSCVLNVASVSGLSIFDSILLSLTFVHIDEILISVFITITVDTSAGGLISPQV